MNAPAPRHDRPLFALGRCQITPDAAALMQEHAASVQDLLWRHQTGDWSRHDPTDPTRAGIPDWGRTCPDDVAANLRALQDGSRIIGFYSLGGDGSVKDSTRVWVITDAIWPDTGRRWLTTILTPWEY